jgi:predicted nucleic acid-binding protein
VKVLVDTSVWSLMLRRDPATLNSIERSIVRELQDLVHDGRVRLIGPIRQELLSGIKTDRQFQQLKEKLAFFEDAELTTADYESAAAAANRCFSVGLAASSIDVLICAMALTRQWEIFATDKDFVRFQSVLKITLHQPK